MGLADIAFGRKDTKKDLLNYFRKNDSYSQLTPDGVKSIEQKINDGSLRKRIQVDKSVELLIKANNFTNDKYGKKYF